MPEKRSSATVPGARGETDLDRSPWISAWELLVDGSVWPVVGGDDWL